MANPNAGVIQRAARTNGTARRPARPIDRLKSVLYAESVQEQFKNALSENSGAFVASIIDLYNTNKYLQACEPQAVVMEALKAASLKLPINKQLGFAWIVPYEKDGQSIPTFQLGYKGYIQLCMRTGAYRYINADVVYEGELVSHDKLTGELELDSTKRTSEKKIGYFAFIETLNGFRKSLFMTVEEVTKHAQRYSKSYGKKNSAWKTDFDAMALKTCLRLLLGKYGVMSVELERAYVDDSAGENAAVADLAIQGDYNPVDDAINATIDAEWSDPEDKEKTPQEADFGSLDDPISDADLNGGSQ